MRIQYKGGVWKNTEDEILKAAVMKYGKNQWPRIASLLVRKSAKQCKARWNEWLDPSIKKTEWTREEEEKLLHLARVMPTAWRTIAPMIGRTAAQCIEHYEKLIDEARQPADGDAGPSPATTGSRLGDMDSVMETRPARPDPVDMDDDEKEMLGEARARLENTKGKKAKRKARERYLEAAKRMVQIQKERELKAAGIEIKKRRKGKKDTDYAVEIPFMRAPAPGFFDTKEEDDQTDKIATEKSHVGKLLQHARGKSLEEKEREERQKDSAKRKKRAGYDPLAALGFEKLPAPADPPLKKARISLPDPLISDSALEKLARSGARPPLPSPNSNSSGAVSAGSWLRTRQRHVKDTLAAQSAQTPLHGGETVVPDLGLDGRVTPAPSHTPAHDQQPSERSASIAADRKRQKEEERKLSSMIRKGLLALPAPQNEYEFDFDDAGDGSDVDATDAEAGLLEDAEEELRKREQEEMKRVPVLKERLLSTVAKRKLPIGETGEMAGGTDSVPFLMHRDKAVLRIVGEFDAGVRKAHDALSELQSVVAKDGADDGDLLEEAHQLVDKQVEEDEAAGYYLKKTIQKVVVEDFKIPKSDGPVNENKNDGYDDEVETILQREGVRRKKIVEDIFVSSGKKGVDGVDDDLNTLWKKIDGEYNKKRICPEAERANDGSSITKMIYGLKKRLPDI